LILWKSKKGEISMDEEEVYEYDGELFIPQEDGSEETNPDYEY
jgi:hypothetical protein